MPAEEEAFSVEVVTVGGESIGSFKVNAEDPWQDVAYVVDGADDVFDALANAPEPDHEVLTSHL